MLVPERHRMIRRLLAERGSISLREVQARLGISAATARRDAEELGRAGLVRRIHGGLLPPDFALHEPAYARKAEKAANAKRQLGEAAARLLPEDGTVFIDAGTTCLEVGRALLDRPRLRIFTNSVSLLALAPTARATLNSLGGELRRVSLALTGALAQDWLERLRFDAAVLGASGIDPDAGAYTTELGEAGVKIEALRRARLRLLVVHGEKWGRPAAVHFAPWTAFHHLVTDRSAIGPDRATALAQAQVIVHTVSAR
jgi:DeoR family fructose operon transcriptional repressor